MKTMTFVLPLSAALMLGTAAFAQSDQPMTNPQTGNAPAQQSYGQPGDQQNMGMSQDQMNNGQMNNGQMNNGQMDNGQSSGRMNGQNSGMGDATMYGSSAGQMDPRQSKMGGMPIDQETTVDGIQAACTGVGDAQENRARWSDYPVKLVVAGDHGQYYAGEHVTVSKGGQQIADMTCNGPWVLMKLQPGSYHATVELPGHASKQISFRAPASGQHEVTVRFATTQEDLGGQNQHRATSASFQQQNGAQQGMQPSGQNGSNGQMYNSPTNNNGMNNTPAPDNGTMQNSGPDQNNNEAANPH